MASNEYTRGPQMTKVMMAQATALKISLKDESVSMVCTSPPYWGLRSYGIGSDNGELGGEERHDCLAWARSEPPCPEGCYICHMRMVFAEVWKVLHPMGTLWLNIGDTYAGSWGAQSRPNGNDKGSTLQGGSMLSARQIEQHPRGTHTGSLKYTPGLKNKDLIGIPWRLALALQQDGWTLRSEIIWEKGSCMPESVQDRVTRSHEQVFLFSKQPTYFYDAQAIAEPMQATSAERYRYAFGGPKNEQLTAEEAHGPGSRTHPIGKRETQGTRNARSVWKINPEPFAGAHFACFPQALAERAILAGSSAHGVCSACGSPWVRMIERITGDNPSYNGSSFTKGKTHDARVHLASVGQQERTVAKHTTGWQPTCSCHAPVTPSVVFDPFCGSGTTLLAARNLGRHGIGTDLSLTYLRDIARSRLGLTALHAWEHGEQAKPVVYDDLPLFAGA